MRVFFCIAMIPVLISFAVADGGKRPRKTKFTNSKTDLSDASSLDFDRVDAERHDALIALLNNIRAEKSG